VSLSLVYDDLARLAYLRHLDRTREILGSRLNTIHNLHFYQALMQSIRSAIEAGRYAAWQAAFLSAQRGGNEDPVA